MERAVVDQARLTEAAAAYRAEGFAVLPSVFTAAEVEGWKRECDRLAGALSQIDEGDGRIQSRSRQGGGMARDRYDPVTEFSTPFRDLASDPRLQAIAAAALGGPPVRFKDRLILKSAGTDGYGLHRDWPYWEFLGIPPDEIVSLMLSVDATDARNGALEVFPGLHGTPLPAALDDPLDLDPRAVEGRVPSVAGTVAGDVLLLHPMAPHRSGPNRSGGSRRILTYIFTLARNADAAARYYAANPGRS